MPEVSIIMPAYNAEHYIGQSIESVQAQAFTDWELLVVDDGSADGTAAVVKEYTARDPRIKYFWRENGRQGKARNTALAAIPADRPFVAFLDADDLWMPEKLGTQLAEIKASGADGVFCSSIVFSAENEHISLLQAEARLFEGEPALKDFIWANKIGILTALVKRKAVSEAGNFPEDRAVQNCEDYYIWIKMLMAGCRLLGNATPMTKYRIHTAASTANLLNTIRPEIAMFHSLTFATEALEHEKRMRLITLYRLLFQKLADDGDKAAIRDAIRSFAAYTGSRRIGNALENVLAVHKGLFKKISWRLLSALTKS